MRKRSSNLTFPANMVSIVLVVTYKFVTLVLRSSSLPRYPTYKWRNKERRRDIRDDTIYMVANENNLPYSKKHVDKNGVG